MNASKKDERSSVKMGVCFSMRLPSIASLPASTNPSFAFSCQPEKKFLFSGKQPVPIAPRAGTHQIEHCIYC
jgi:hypothetical protein